MILPKVVPGPGYVRLLRASAEYHEEPVCPQCKNPNYELIGTGSRAECMCPECGEEFFPEQALVLNFFADAMRIWGEKGYDSARFDHVHVLADHAEELHLRIVELEELLAVERRRAAGAQRVVEECALLMGDIKKVAQGVANAS